MAAPQNHWKLGLFVVSGLFLFLTAVALLSARSMHKEVGLYMSYFDESVQGLEVGSPIKFRGVNIGTVGKIEVAPDHRHVEVESELGVDKLTRLGLDVAKGAVNFGEPRKLEMAPDLRLQLTFSGLTGGKFLQLDFFDVKKYPPPVLPFPVPKNYIPTAPSMVKGLEDSVTHLIFKLAEISDKTASILEKVDVFFREAQDRELPRRLGDTLNAATGLLKMAYRKLDKLNTAGLSQGTQQALASVNNAMDGLSKILEGMAQDDGLFKSIERASDAVGDTLSSAYGLGGQLVDTLSKVQSAVQTVQKFIEALEQDPDMLLKGRRLEKTP